MYSNTLAPIRNSRSPLTLDQIRKAAPSAFASEAYAGMSGRYAYIPTSDVIAGMMTAGFQPFAASQSRARTEDKAAHTKHMIRFRAADTAITLNGEAFPELVLVNSHDGTSAYKLMAGLFRLVCSNGLIVADSLIGSVSIRHQGNVIEQAATKSFELMRDMPKAIDTVAQWKAIELTADEKGIYAEAAHAVRFADADGTIDTPIRPDQLLAPRRYDDNASNLWSVFNRVQENAVKGGLSAYNRRTLSRSTSRAVRGIDQDVRLNRALWTLTEKMAALRS